MECKHSNTRSVPARVGNEHEMVEVCLDCEWVCPQLLGYEWGPDNFTPPLLPQALEVAEAEAAHSSTS
ncbi:MAG: hypothetical protein JWO96_141 [Candidatus Saccharibacteria bacterium]|nr:hypothetical protein [Candidatus Saccharibacteria bacterium]